MATIKDVAALAGVSHGTVSNFLNGAIGVSPDKIARIEEAMRELDYTPNTQAQNLKKKKLMQFNVILPTLLDPSIAQLYTSIEEFAEASKYSVNLNITNEFPQKETMYLEIASRNSCDGVIIMTCQPDNTALFKDLIDKGLRIVFIQRKVKNLEQYYAGIDAYQPINESIKKNILDGKRRIAIITGPKEYSFESDCIVSYMNSHYSSGLTIDYDYIESTDYTMESAFISAVKLLKLENPPDAIYITSELMLKGVLKAIELINLPDDILASIYVLSSYSWIHVNQNRSKYIYLPYINLAENAVNLLIKDVGHVSEDQPKELSMTLDAMAAQEEYKSKTLNKKRPLRILLCKERCAAATQILINDFTRKTGIQADITSISFLDLYPCVINNNKNDRYFDVFYLDLPWMKELVELNILESIQPYLDKIPSVKDRFPQLIFDSYAIYNDIAYALPYVYVVQLLFYRKDLFDNIQYKREYYKVNKAALTVPTTWNEYNQIAKFFTRKYNPNSPTEYGVSQGGRVPTSAVCEYLPRLWDFNGEPFDDHKIAINSQAALEALENYIESFKYATPSSPNIWWDSLFDEFVKEEAAMIMSFSDCAIKINSKSSSKIAGKVDASIVPGNMSVLGGCSLGISTISDMKDEAFQFINWATSNNMAIPSTLLGGFIPTNEMYKNMEIVNFLPWQRKIIDVFQNAHRRFVPSSSMEKWVSEHKFEEALGQPICDAILKRISPKEALDLAAKNLSEFLILNTD